MNLKLLSLILVICGAGLLSSCSEEEIVPIDKQKGSATGVGQDDKGF